MEKMWKTKGSVEYFGNNLARESVLMLLADYNLDTEENIDYVNWVFDTREPFLGETLYDYIDEIVEDEWLEETVCYDEWGRC